MLWAKFKWHCLSGSRKEGKNGKCLTPPPPTITTTTTNSVQMSKRNPNILCILWGTWNLSYRKYCLVFKNWNIKCWIKNVKNSVMCDFIFDLSNSLKWFLYSRHLPSEFIHHSTCFVLEKIQIHTINVLFNSRILTIKIFWDVP